jgi:hypothetical protein
VAWRWWLHHKARRGTRVVTLESGTPVAGVRVEARDVLTFAILASAVSDADGRFTLSGFTADEVGVWLDGSSAGREKGYAAADGGVVAAWGDAVSWGAESMPTVVRLRPA